MLKLPIESTRLVVRPTPSISWRDFDRDIERAANQVTGATPLQAKTYMMEYFAFSDEGVHLLIKF